MKGAVQQIQQIQTQAQTTSVFYEMARKKHHFTFHGGPRADKQSSMTHVCIVLFIVLTFVGLVGLYIRVGTSVATGNNRKSRARSATAVRYGAFMLACAYVSLVSSASAIRGTSDWSSVLRLLCDWMRWMSSGLFSCVPVVGRRPAAARCS